MPRLLCVLVCFSTIACLTATGCNQPASKPPAAHDDHDHKGHAHDDHKDGDHKKDHGDETFAGVVKELLKMRDGLKEAFAKKDNKAADDLLHEIGHTLSEVDDLAKKASLPQAKLDAIHKTKEELLDLFGEVDDFVHSGKGSPYEKVSTKTDAGLEELRKAAEGK